jgi:SAM-dependent methyltransferase
LRRGEVVLDLGSGGGKICYIAAQVVGAEGRVIGIDMNDEMLQLAESHREAIAERLGYSNVSFYKAKIQDLSLDYGKLERFLADHPVGTVEDWERLEAWQSDQRRRSPLIADGSVDVVVSNCVLNLVPAQDKAGLFREIHRVLRNGGRAVISDITCDEDVPAELRADPQLWSGCLAGAFREDLLPRAFEEAGFHGIRILERDEKPWQVVDGVEFRSVTLEAFKGKEGPCLELNQAVIYRGPWRSVTDDDGHTLHRGQRVAVCDKTFRLYTREPYATEIVPVLPYVEILPRQALPFDCRRDAIRGARETKGEGYRVTRVADSPCCGSEDSCG